ncbi:MAG: FKBP-type peptidyl-prolyl cis-trans isomerase [Chitinivibrionales bacterium]|nr:FKBP-type peptidyl-prolyl cis-trans isomerase [Chitinivibrionales bacterium]
MKSCFSIAAVPFIAVMVYSCTAKTAGTAAKIDLKTTQDSVSYIIGTDIANSLKQVKDQINVAVLLRGFQDQLAAKESPIAPERAQAIMQAFSAKMRDKQAEQSKVQGEKNLAEGKKFLEENGKKPGVVTTPSGLQYLVLAKGTGPTPKTDSTKVTVQYKGTLLDGTEFDSSYKRGQPAVFPLNGVIKGWTEGVKLMPVGSKYRFFVPAELAYGDRGAGQQIAPNATLIFEIELISIEK